MEENKKKFIPALIDTVKYSKKVRVADIKKYLVDEFKLSKDLNKENQDLRKTIEKNKIVEEKYNVSLITLDEYKRRLVEKDKELQKQQKELETKNSKIAELSAKITDYKMKASDISLRVETIKKDAIKEYKRELLKSVNELGGHITKAKVFEIIKNGVTK